GPFLSKAGAMTAPDRGTEGEDLPGLVLAQELPWPSNLRPALSPTSRGMDAAPFELASRRPLAWARLSSGRLAEVARILLVALAFLGALLAMTVSATGGTLTLVLSGAVPATSFWPTWSVWWTGDAMGVLVVAPFLLSLRSGSSHVPPSWRRRAEAGVVVVATG